MRCQEALHYWEQELLGQPVDKERLQEAYAHIGACQELCAQILGASPETDGLSTPEQRSGQTDLYEALGLSAEEEGDARARTWTRMRRLVAAGKANQAALDRERALALAAWQSAANYYADGLRAGRTAFLTESLKRIKRKRLEPGASGRFTKTDPRSRASRAPGRKTPEPGVRPAPPGSAARPRLPVRAWPHLALVAHKSTRRISVGQRPAGWHIGTLPSDEPLLIREHAAPYQASAPDTQTLEDVMELGQPAVNGRLDPFDLALWATASARKWELELLVRAQSARHPWTGIMLTLENEEQHLTRPTLMEFSRLDAQNSGWWARLKEVDAQAYQLHFSANDSNGQAAEAATLDLSLLTED